MGWGVVQTADAATSEVSDLLGRMRELAVQSSSGTLNDTQRGYLQDEFNALSQEIDRIAGGTEFNGMTLTDGSTPSIDVQVGTDGTADSQMTVGMGDVTTGSLGLGGASVATQGDAQGGD